MPAAPAGGESVALRIGGYRGNQTPTTAAVQVADHAAFGAQGQTVGDVLDVAAGDDPTVVGETGGPHREVGVGGVGPPGRRGGRGP